MKWDPAGTSTQKTTSSVSVAPSHRERQRQRVWVCFPICVTLSAPGYWLVCAKHRCSMSGIRELEFCLCTPFIYSSFIWLPYPPFFLSFSMLYLILSLWFSPISTPQVYSRLYSHLFIFASLFSLSAPFNSPSFCLSIFFSPGLTVWKLDESDCVWQSGMWVNLMWLIWCLLTALWKSFTVEEHWDTAPHCPSYPPSPCC